MQKPQDPNPGSKYSIDAPFCEPIVRCDACQQINFLDKVKQKGGCHYCGNNRVKNVLTMTPDEMRKIKDEVDPEFLALFEEA